MRAPQHPDYEVVIGLEVHVHLRTESKLFSSAAVSYGDAPNHHVSPVCLAMPGALPVLNGVAVELAIRAALATHCVVHAHSVFARKNYFYPDLPKGYQISQFEEPLATEGWIEIGEVDDAGEGGTRRIGLTRIHMEEDAGKSLHDEGALDTHVDLNRAGVPLVEIVSEPDLRSPEEACAYLRKLRAILRYVGASDADMEKGQFRCDANVSLRRHGESRLGTRTELKNLNSFRNVDVAIRTEVERQARVLDDGGEIQQATLGFDAEAGRIFTMRLKENSDDYRYFPDPDLIPLVISSERIEEIRAALPELPEARQQRFETEYGLAPGDALQLTGSRALADYFESAVAARATARSAANWLLRDLQALLRDRDAEIEDVRLAPEELAALIRLVDDGRLTARNARELLAELLWSGGDPEALVRERGLEAVSDAGELEALADEVIADQPKAVASFAAGDAKAVNFLMGQVMRRTGGKADPAAVREILIRKLGG
jgi:aspartyl-tRNA(Asn)/glutamyl-tRNA(Gln) amidotransferase subunit B